MSIRKDIHIFGAADWAAAAIEEVDLPALQELCEICADYFLITTGKAPGRSEAQTPAGFAASLETLEWKVQTRGQ